MQVLIKPWHGRRHGATPGATITRCASKVTATQRAQQVQATMVKGNALLTLKLGGQENNTRAHISCCQLPWLEHGGCHVRVDALQPFFCPSCSFATSSSLPTCVQEQPNATAHVKQVVKLQAGLFLVFMWLANVSQTCGGMCTWSPYVYKAPTMRSTSSFSDNVKTSTPDMSGRHGRPRGLAIGRGNLQSADMSAAHVACDVNNHMDREAKHVKTQLTIRCNKKLHQAIMQFNLR